MTSIAKISTRAGVHRTNKHEGSGEGDASGTARDGHLPVFEGLAQDLEGSALEFGKFVEKEDPVMGK
jgi:hypothetical protein